MKNIQKFLILIITSITLPTIKLRSVPIFDHIIGDGMDNLLNITLFEKNILNFKTFLSCGDVTTLYTTVGFFPYQFTSLFTESLYFPTAIYFLLKAILNSQTLSYNGLFLVSAIFNFFSFYYLTKVLKQSFFLSLFGSILYTTGHFFTIQYVHIQNQFAFGFPLVFAFIYQFIEFRKHKFLYFIAITLILQFFSCTYYGVYLLYFSFLIYLIFLFQIQRQKKISIYKIHNLLLKNGILKFLFAICSFVIIVFSVYGLFFYTNLELYPKRELIENVFYSNTLSSIFNLTTTTSTFDSYALYGLTHNSVHIGYFTFIFILSSIFLIKKLKPDVLMYLIFAVFFFLLSLGPKISIFNFEISNLYTVLYKFFPGFKNLRVPSRIFIVSWFFLSLYITLIIPFFRIIWKKNIAVILGIFLLFELCFMSQYKEASALPIQIKKEKFPTIENGNIVFISYKNREIKLINNSFPEWYLLNSNLKTPNGYSGITLPFQYYINNLFYHHLLNDELLNYLHRFNISYIAAKIEGFQDEAFFNQTHLSASKSLQFVGKDTENHFIFFKISPTLLKVNVQSNSSRSPLNFKITNQSIPKKIEFLTDHNEKTYWQSHANGYQSEADFIELKLFNKNENTIFVKMNAGPFIEKLPYGIGMRCGDQIYDFNFPKLNSIEFVQNPLKPHSLVFPLENCLKDHLEIRVSRNTPYAILMLAELEIYEAKK